MITTDDPFDLEAYFTRIGYHGPAAPTLDTLRALHLLHPQAIPFENLDPLLGCVPALDPRALQAKLVRGGRGGYCYEHNLLFAQALAAIGFRITGLAARVLWHQPENAITARSHMLLRVEVGGESWIADVGFGGLTLTAPLRLAAGPEQPTPHETFRLVEAGACLRMEARLGDAWRALYRFDLQEQVRPDYEVGNWFLSTHPASRFVTGLMVARRTATGGHALLDNRLVSHHPDGSDPGRHLGSVAALRQALEGVFGIVLPEAGTIDTTLARLAAKDAQASPCLPQPGIACICRAS